MTTATIDLLTALVNRALAAYPAEAARIHRGAALVATTTLHDDGSATVLSNCHRWHVRPGQCPCPDAALGHAPMSRCKHRYAACLARKLQALEPAWLPKRFHARWGDLEGIAGAKADGTVWFQPAGTDVWGPVSLCDVTLLGLVEVQHA